MTTLRTVATIAVVLITGQSGETVQTWIDDLIETIRVTPSSTDHPGASRKADQSPIARHDSGRIDSDAEAIEWALFQANGDLRKLKRSRKAAT